MTPRFYKSLLFGSLNIKTDFGERLRFFVISIDSGHLTNISISISITNGKFALSDISITINLDTREVGYSRFHIFIRSSVFCQNSKPYSAVELIFWVKLGFFYHVTISACT